MSKKICFSTLLIYFCVMCLFVVLRICSHCGVFSFLGDYSSLVFSLITQILLICLLPILTFKKANKVKSSDMKNFLNLRKTSWKVLGLSVLLGIVVFFVTLYVSSFFNSIIQVFGYTPASSSSSSISTWGGFFLELFLTAVLPAICEELLHRGMLLSGTSQLGLKKSIIISGLLFGLLHMNIEQVFYASIIGLFLGYLACGCNSIYPCMIVHFMNNAISVTLSFMSARGVNFYSMISAFFTKNSLLGVIMLVLILCILLFVGVQIVHAMFKESFRFNFVKKQKELSARAIRNNFFADVEKIKSGEAENERIYTAERNVIRIDLDHFMAILNENMEEMREAEKRDKSVEKVVTKTKVDKNIDLKIKILLWGCFVLGIVMNVLTFIWGLFR